MHWARSQPPELSGYEKHPVGCGGYRLRCHPPRFWLFVGKPGLCPPGGDLRHHIHRPQRRCHRTDGRQGHGPPYGAAGRGACGARFGGRGGKRRPGGGDRPADRLPGVDQGSGRRRRPGHAPGGQRRRAAGAVRCGPGRSRSLFWRWQHVPGKADPFAQAHRISDFGRRLRQYGASGGTGLFHPAPQPEDGGGIPLPHPDPGAAGADGPGCRAGRPGCGLPQCGHSGIRAG